jgi:hypothetical protein
MPAKKSYPQQFSIFLHDLGFFLINQFEPKGDANRKKRMKIKQSK